MLSPDASDHGISAIEAGHLKKIHVDVVFPVLHGLFGEDGTVQGLLELARIPYVGCGVLFSAVSMDKFYTKLIVDRLGIRQADYEPVRKEELVCMDQVIDRIESRFSYPVFVKPSNAGSSRGVGKAENRQMLEEALAEAARHDRKILVEETIVGHEVECAVFGGGQTEIGVSGVGEILAAADFYDFEAKYYNEESRTVTDPELPGGAAQDPTGSKSHFSGSRRLWVVSGGLFCDRRRGSRVQRDQHHAGIYGNQYVSCSGKPGGLTKSSW